MFRFILVCSMLILRLVCANAQSMAQHLFQSTCEELEQMDRYWQARQKLPPFTLRVDTAKGEEWMEFADGTGKRIRGKTGDAELEKVAHAIPLPVFPLRDTVRIIDTTGNFVYLRDVRGMLINGYYFDVHRCAAGKCADHKNIGTMYILPILSPGASKIYLQFGFEGTADIFHCSIGMGKSGSRNVKSWVDKTIEAE